MCKRIALLWFILGIAFTGFSQTGTISGKVTNSRNEQLVGVTVKIEGLPGAITTDIDGRYTIKLEASKKYKIEFTAVGYQPKSIEEVSVVAGEETTLDVLMEDSKKNQLSEVVIKGSSPRRETVNALINFQKNTPVVAQVISAEAIRRSPDKNTGEVLKRVPGTSIQEGKYLVVRGLADRYNLAMLNGVMLSSTEPDRKTFSFDIFPAAMIDNIIMNKTFIPELPGEWAGGLVQVNTRDIPSANFFNFQIGSGFNTQTIGKDFLKYKGGKTDWLGIDDGCRALPSSMPTKSEFAEMTSVSRLPLERTSKISGQPKRVISP